jgi:hypothetical protein
MKHEEIPDDSKLEAALRAALQREQPPLGFAQRLEARLAAQRESTATKRVLSWRMPSVRIGWQFAAAAVLLLAITLPLGLRLHHRAEVARGEAAKQQVMLALRITGMQLRSIQERTQSINTGAMPEGETQ